MAESFDDPAPGILPRRRHPCGKPLRPTTRRARRQKALERTRETVAEVKGVVLLQPHRKGREDWGRATAIGRLILDEVVVPLDAGETAEDRERSRRIAIDAAERYLRAYQGYQWAISSKRSWSGSTPASTRMHV